MEWRCDNCLFWNLQRICANKESLVFEEYTAPEYGCEDFKEARVRTEKENWECEKQEKERVEDTIKHLKLKIESLEYESKQQGRVIEADEEHLRKAYGRIAELKQKEKDRVKELIKFAKWDCLSHVCNGIGFDFIGVEMLLEKIDKIWTEEE